MDWMEAGGGLHCRYPVGYLIGRRWQTDGQRNVSMLIHSLLKQRRARIQRLRGHRAGRMLATVRYRIERDTNLGEHITP
jgi:hypothetical protein